MLLLHGRLLVGKRSIVYVGNELKLLGWNESLQEHNWHVQINSLDDQFCNFSGGQTSSKQKCDSNRLS